MSEDGNGTVQDKDQIIAEEYETWMKNCPYMYLMVSETALPWPSLTFQWLPENEVSDDVATQQLLLGTYTAGSDKEYLQVASVNFPIGDYDKEDSPEVNTQIQIQKRILHEGEVNRARYLPQQTNIVATASVSGDVYLFDTSTDVDENNQQFNPVATLKGHTLNGYGICWSKFNKGSLISSSDDSTVALWDAQSAKGTTSPLVKYTDHSDVVNDVDFHHQNSYFFGSVSDDKKLNLYDIREAKAIDSITVHEDAVNSLAFSPFSHYLLSTVSADQTVAIWDSRNLKQRLHSLMAHSDSVTSVEWSPHVDGVLGSAGLDRRVILWDISKIGEEQTPEDAEDGAPELLFMHGGHTNTVNDFGFNPIHQWYLGSVSDDNIGQIWKPSDNIVGRTEEDVKNSELE